MTEEKKHEVQRVEQQIVKPKSQDNFWEMVERLATNPSVDVSKIKQIVEIQEHIFDRNAETEFNAAMSRAQEKMPTVPKDLKNQQTNSSYSAYETILKYTKPVYTEEGFSISMFEGDTPKEGHIRVVADVMHKYGHSKTKWVDVPMDDKGIKGTVNKTLTHAKKSSLSYGKGIMMCMIFNIPTGDDDDGNAAGGPEYIDEKQLNSITDMILARWPEEVREKNEAIFLNHMKVESVDKILSKDFQKAVEALKPLKVKK